MPAQISFPVIDRDGLENVVRRFEELRLAHIDVARLGQFDFLKIIRPIPIRRERLQLRLLHLVVIFLRIAHLDPRPGGFGQRGLESHDLLRMLRRLIGRLAEEREHFRHVLDVLVAEFFRSRVFLCVVIAVRQTEPALRGVGNHHRAVLRVLIGAEAEEPAHADRVQVRDFLKNVAAIFQRVDPFEFIGQRRNARAVHRFFIHSARVRVADLLQIDFSRLLGIWFRGNFRCDYRRLLHDLVQRIVILLGQHIETAPARKLRRNRIAFYPAAIRVKIKIVLRLDGRIHVFRIEGQRVFFDRRRFVGCRRTSRYCRRRDLIARRFLFRRFSGRRCLRLQI